LGNGPTAGAVDYFLAPLRGSLLASARRAGMNWIDPNRWLIPGLVVRCTTGTKCRQTVAHGTSRGFSRPNTISPEGAKEAWLIRLPIS